MIHLIRMGCFLYWYGYTGTSSHINYKRLIFWLLHSQLYNFIVVDYDNARYYFMGARCLHLTNKELKDNNHTLVKVDVTTAIIIIFILKNITNHLTVFSFQLRSFCGKRKFWVGGNIIAMTLNSENIKLLVWSKTYTFFLKILNHLHFDEKHFF